MARRKNAIIAASVVAQAKKIAASNESDVSSVVVLSDRGRLQSRVDRTPDPETGNSRLRVIIPGAARPDVYEFTQFLAHPQLADFLAEGFRCWAQGKEPTSIGNVSRDLLRGIAKYLSLFPAHSVTPKTIDESFWTGFLRFLDAPTKRGQPLALSSRASLLGAVGGCINALEGHVVWGYAAERLIHSSGFPRNPWPGRYKKNKPTEIILPHNVDRILNACIADVAAIKARLDNNDLILASGQEILKAAQASCEDPNYESLSVCSAIILEAFPSKLALLTDLNQLDPKLGYAVCFNHGMAEIRRTLYNSFEDLVPFVVLIGFKTIFNPDTLLSLEWGALQTSFDGATIILHGGKPRSTKMQTSTHDAEDDVAKVTLPSELGTPLGFGDLLDILDRLTMRTRGIVSNKADASRLFVGVPINSGTVAKAFLHKIGPSSDTTWNTALKKFISRHNLPAFTLRSIRATGADQTRRDFGVFAQQAQQGHASPQTTRTFYTSDWVRKQGQDRIGEMQDLYVRASETLGRIDPRGAGGKGQLAAATPGFLCLDPYDSPRPGQKKNRLCAAYGECPSCPFAAVELHNEQAVAKYLALRNALHAGQQGLVSVVQWQEKWTLILRDLEQLLAEIPQDVLEAAKQYRVSVPAIG
ncbi:hypothetical protein [Leisingera sp. ANG-S5]|uniref:hypothetical protein n=1 Tax=Leisingera sp. ANG-S5 TaxID=1577901 RepID=UPI000AFD8A0A|nr:hypothetical protein [Leisingera sp. ANG-S5]